MKLRDMPAAAIGSPSGQDASALEQKSVPGISDAAGSIVHIAIPPIGIFPKGRLFRQVEHRAKLGNMETLIEPVRKEGHWKSREQVVSRPIACIVLWQCCDE
jgi:hypothetical protein